MNFIEVYDNALSPELCKEIIGYFEECPDELKHKGQIYGRDHNDIKAVSYTHLTLPTNVQV